MAESYVSLGSRRTGIQWYLLTVIKSVGNLFFFLFLFLHVHPHRSKSHSCGEREKRKKRSLSNNTHSDRPTVQESKRRQENQDVVFLMLPKASWTGDVNSVVESVHVLKTFVRLWSACPHIGCVLSFLSAWFHPVLAFCTVAETFLTSTTLKVLLLSSGYLTCLHL